MDLADKAAPSPPPDETTAARIAEHRARARSLGAAQDVEGAVEAWRQVVALDPSDREANLRLSEFLYDNEATRSQATPHLRVVVERDQGKVKPAQRLARALEAAGELDEAIDVWTKVQAKIPQDLETQERLCALLSARGRWQEAIPYLRAAAEREGSPKSWHRLARAYDATADAEGALNAWRMACEIDPTIFEPHDRIADLLVAAGRLAEAIPHLRAVAEHDGSAKSWHRVARAYDAIGDAEGATDAWRTACEIDPAIFEPHDRIADLLVAAGRLAEAVPHLRAVAEHDGSAKSWHRAARAYEAVGDAEGAIEAWLTASRIDPTIAEPHEHLAELLTNKRPLESIPHLRWLAQADGGKLKVWQRLARALEQAGDLAGSVEAWKEVAALAPLDAEASLKLSRGLPKLGRWLEAIPHAEAVARKTGDNAKVWINLARLLKRAGAAEDELRAWRQVLFLDPRSVEAHSRLAHLLWTSDRKSEAAEHMKALAGLGPGEIGRWKQLAGALQDIGDRTGAIGALRKALAIRPDDISSHETMGDLLLALGRKPEAVQHMRRYAELSGERSKPWRNLARLLEELGRERDALRAWRRVLKVSESDSEAHERLASLSGREGDKAGAIRHIEALARIAPKDAAGWDRLARARADVGDLAGAVDAWLKALAAAEEPEFHTQVGIALLPLDRKAAALEHFQRAVALTPMEERRWRHLARCAQDVGATAVAADAWRQVLALTGTDEEARVGLLALGGSREEELSVQSDAGYAAALLRFWSEVSARDEPNQETVRHISRELAKVIGEVTGFARITHPEAISRRLQTLDQIFRDPRFASLTAARPDEIQEVLTGLEGDGAALAQQALLAAGPDLARALIAAPASAAAKFAVDETQARAQRVTADPVFQRPVIICGFHHSGTRVLAQALQNAGVFQKMNTPSLEWTYVQWLNTVMLPGWTDVEAIRSFDPAAAGAFISQGDLAFRLAAAGYGGQAPWAHKDPRNSVTAGAWLKAFPGSRIVHITRQPADVLGTLPARYARYSPDGKLPQQTLDFWSGLWTAYLDATRAAMADAAHSIEVTFEDLCREPEAVMDGIAKALDLDARLSAEDIAGLGLNPEKIGEHRLWIDRGQLDGADLARLEALGAASLPQ